MDAVKYLKEQKRMCANYNYCNECPFVEKMEGDGFGYCTVWQRLFPAEAVRIVEKWSKEHPIQTRADKFKEVFGVTVWESIDEGHGDWSKWWDIPYEAPKGEDNG